ncbi:hypothetical protein, partial [Veronia pacifica]
MSDIHISSLESISVDGFNLKIIGQDGKPVLIEDGLLLLAKGTLTLNHKGETVPLYQVLDLAGLNAQILSEFINLGNLFNTENGESLFQLIASLRQKRLDALLELQEIEGEINYAQNSEINIKQLRELNEIKSEIQRLDTDIHN